MQQDLMIFTIRSLEKL